MSSLDAFLTPSKSVTKQTIASGAAGAAVAIGKRSLVAVSSTGPFHVALGTAGVTADANSFLFPTSGVAQFQLGNENTHVRVFNDSGANIDVYIMPLAR